MRYAPPLHTVWNCLPNTFALTSGAGIHAASSSFFASVSIISGTIRIMFGSNSLMFFATRSSESLMQITEPMEMPFKISMLRQYAWWMGRTDRITMPDSSPMSRQVAFSARFLCVSMTPLLLPVVPDVNMIVASWSGCGV